MCRDGALSVTIFLIYTFLSPFHRRLQGRKNMKGEKRRKLTKGKRKGGKSNTKNKTHLKC